MRHAPVIALCVAACVLVLAAAPAGAARAPITGKLSKPGYTVIALASNGKARSVRVRPNGSFRLRLPADSATLHLRTSRGRYGGPIVIRATRTRAVVGVRAGASLGTISVRRGYARVLRRLPDSSVDPARDARARRGVPIGARRFGRVRSRPPRGAPAGDRDLDGIPNPLDIDDDGDLILDNLDRSTGARASAFATIFNPFSQLTLELPHSVNANAAAVTTAQIDAALSNFSSLYMGVLPGDSAELDCGGANQSPARPQGLIYCSRGGTGTLFGTTVPGQRFPECCDPDGDGFGTLTAQGAFGGMGLEHHARTDQIGTGDILIERVTTGGVETLFPATLQYVFATVPALVSYSDGAGNAGTLSYPVAAAPPGNGFPVAPRPGGAAAGDVVLTLKFWRPQRSRIAGESGEWTDIGRLVYTAGVADVGAFCPQSAFSETDPKLVPPTSPVHRPGAGGFTDLADDQPASATNSFTYTLNVTKCLAAKGLPPWNAGEVRRLALSALSPVGADEAQQVVPFKRL